MRTACIFSGDIEPGQSATGIDIDHDATHEIVRRRHHFDPPASQIETTIGAAFDHTGKLSRYIFRAEMTHCNIDATVGCRIATTHFGINSTADDIAGCALARRIVVRHKTFTVTV